MAHVSPSDPAATLSTCFARSRDARTGFSGCARRGGATTVARRSNRAATAAAVPASCSSPVRPWAARAPRPSSLLPHQGAAPRGPLPHRARSAPAPHRPTPQPSSAASRCSSHPVALRSRTADSYATADPDRGEVAMFDPVPDRLLIHLERRGDLGDGEELLGLGHRDQSLRDRRQARTPGLDATRAEAARPHTSGHARAGRHRSSPEIRT